MRALDKGGFPIKQVSVIGQNMEDVKTVHDFVTEGDVAKTGAKAGAWLGGIFGLLVGAAFIWVPGFGPLVVADSFASILLGTLEGAVVGAAGGGVLVGLVGWGVSKKHILKYEEELKSGKYLVIANGTADEVAKAQNILKDTRALDVNHHNEVAVHA